MEGPNWNRPHGSVDDLIMPTERGVVDAYPTFGSNTRRPSIIPSDLYMPNVAPVTFIPESPFSSSSPSNPSDPLSSLTPSSALSSLPPSSLDSLLGGTFVEVAGPCFSNTRSGQHAVYSLTTGTISCYRHPTSPFHWSGFRNGDLQFDQFSWNLQLPNNLSPAYVREIMALHKTLANALHTNYSGRHTNLSVDTTLSRIQPSVNRHLYSNTMADHSTVHILFDFPFLERRLLNGKDIQVKVVITIEFYQAPWRAGTKRWNRRGSLNVINVACHMINDFGDLYTFLEVVAMDPMPDSRIVQSQVTPASISALQPPIVPTTAAFTNPGPLLAQNALLPVIMPRAPNSTGQGSQAVSNPVPGQDLDQDLDQDNMLIMAETTPCFNNASIGLSPPTSSGSDALSEPGLPRNQSHFGPSNPQGLGDVQFESSMSSSFQQDIQLSFTNDDSLIADTSAMLLQTPGTDDHQMVDDPASSFEIIDNNGESHSMVVSDLQDDGALVVNLDADQSATTPTNSARRFPCPYPGCTKPPFTKKGNMKSHLNTHFGVLFPCSYTGCDEVYGRYGDRLRHIQIVHLGCLWSCDHCLKVHVRKPTVVQMTGCLKNKGGSHAFRKCDKSSASSSVSVAVDVP